MRRSLVTLSIAISTIMLASVARADTFGIGIEWAITTSPTPPDIVLEANSTSNGRPPAPNDFVSATRSDYLQSWSISIRSWVINSTSIIEMSNIASVDIDFLRMWGNGTQSYQSILDLLNYSFMSRWTSDVHHVNVDLQDFPQPEIVNVNGFPQNYTWDTNTQGLTTTLTFSPALALHVVFQRATPVVPIENPISNIQPILSVVVVLIAFAFVISILASVVRRRRG